MKKIGWLGVVLLALLPVSGATAGVLKRQQLVADGNHTDRLTLAIHGKIIDHTNNHGKDNRIFSPALFQKRDLYVYLPPRFDPNVRYPLLIWLHGFAQDEQSFVNDVVPLIDTAIAEHKLPPLIVAAPDGSLSGSASLSSAGSFFLNSRAGDFQDYVLQDVWDFVVEHYPIRPERQAHIIAGVSMGGLGAYNMAIKHRECFGMVIGIFPPLNLRWLNSKGRYFGNFDPKNWGWRTSVDQGWEPIARFMGGLFTIRLRQVVDPLYGDGLSALWAVAKENPIEMIDPYHLRNGELAMYVGYGGKDEFNIDAQVESFLYLARCRGICVDVGYLPNGRHNVATAKKLFPAIRDWMAPLIAPYSPPLVEEGPACAVPCEAGAGKCACKK